MQGQTVVITGASSGFGRGIALRCAERGANVVVAARRKDLLDALSEECGRNALAVHCDVGNPDDVEKLARAAVARFNRIDVWINNAGVAALGPFDEIPVEDHVRVIQTNLAGTIAGSHAALTRFRRQGFGTLINMASMLGHTPAPYFASYCASKFGIVGLCGALRQEMQAQGHDAIHICAILPMAADTTFYEHAANYTGHTLQPYPITDPSEVIDAVIEAIDRPRAEINVGLPAQAASLSQQILPRLTESVTATVSHQIQMEDAPPASTTRGNLHSPVAMGRGINGNVRSRMAQERGGAH
ncbi:SDR family NAD(P)-dependent oxidoreductase [Cognatilysobacter bugurensis]|uniref:Short-chain dehydrogenase n=1 Tax=Cognatilysobacter bugurensis TaxID=543356 RepID=A0A918STA4_9GAMM|nr:SDR family NAD(P)-dependent oxidoreductase [Lysobacter bugurensis]GHA70262.1 short-chain dehydrogenase [Lysobacter bugurensis]